MLRICFNVYDPPWERTDDEGVEDDPAPSGYEYLALILAQLLKDAS